MVVSKKQTAALEHGIQQLACGVVARDPLDRFSFVNDTFCHWTGYAREELIGQPGTMLAPDESQDAPASRYRVPEGGDPRAVVSVIRRKDGTTFPVMLIPQVRHDGESDRYAVVVSLDTIYTARSRGVGDAATLRVQLDRLALQLRTIAIAANVDHRHYPETLVQHPALDGLSPREKEVLARLVLGDRVADIAEELKISRRTVYSHLSTMYKRLGVNSQAALIGRVRGLSQES